MILENERAERLDLGGEWLFEGAGTGSRPIRVPACWEAEGVDRNFAGPARYRRTFEVPARWRGRRLRLRFDAVSFESRILVNGAEAGAHRGAWAPFEVDVTSFVRPGETAAIEVEVSRPGGATPLRKALAGFLPDVATPFGGPWQPVTLLAHDAAAITILRQRPDLREGAIDLLVRVTSFDAADREISLRAAMAPDDVRTNPGARVTRVLPGGGTLDVEFTLPAPDLAPWSPARPSLHEMVVAVEHEGRILAAARRRMGLRHVAAEGGRLSLNGRPLFLRGALSWGFDAARIAPALPRGAVRDEFRRIRDLGFNLLKLCLFVPDETLFDVADEEGMLLWLELPLWLPDMDPGVRDLARAEYADILDRVAHHPSLVAVSLGCELDRTVDGAFLRELDTLARTRIHGAVFCDNSGSGEAYGGLTTDLADFNDYHFYCELHAFDGLVDHFRRDHRPIRPWIFGEFCDCDTFRDPAELVARNDGRPPWWMTEDLPLRRPETVALLEAEPRIEAAALPVSRADVRRIADEQALDARKVILEKVRRRAHMGGFVVTGLRDTPVATSGLFDDFNRPRVDAGRFRAFNADDVLLLDLPRFRNWEAGGDRPDPRDPFNVVAGTDVERVLVLSSVEDLRDAAAEIEWTARLSDGRTVGQGLGLVRVSAPPLTPAQIGRIHFAAPPGPARIVVEVRATLGRLRIANAWDVWAWPAAGRDDFAGLGRLDPTGALDGLDNAVREATLVAPGDPVPPGCRAVLASMLTAELLEFVRSGGRAVLIQNGDAPLAVRRGPFWREAIRILCPSPFWDAFPARGYAGLQFYGMAGDRWFTPDAALPDGTRLTPLLLRLDARDFRPGSWIASARLGRGHLVATTLRLAGGLGDQPASLRNSPAARHMLLRLLRSEAP